MSDPYKSTQGESLIVLWTLDPHGRRVGKLNGKSPDVSALAGIAFEGVNSKLQTDYGWSEQEIESSHILDGLAAVLQSSTSQHTIMHETKIEGCVASLSVKAFSHDGKKLLSLTDGRNCLRRKEANLCRSLEYFNKT